MHRRGLELASLAALAPASAFQNDEVENNNGSERIDIEVKKGLAFVP